MNLQGQNILIAAQFAPPFGGNFIPSIKALADKLERQFGAKVFFAFPSAARDLEWARTLNEDYTIFFTGDTSRLIYREEARRIVEECKPTLIYTHFEGYDTAFLPFINKSVPVVHHMHDTLYFQRHPLKRLYQVYSFWRHYGRPTLSHRVAHIAVCEHELSFIRPFLMGRKAPKLYLPNAISPDRIKAVIPAMRKNFNFLTIGGRNVQKRIDLCIDAAKMLAEKRGDFSLTLLRGVDTDEVVQSKLGDRHPEWLRVIDAVADINCVFAEADCFISSSVHETFSYAVAEASIAGLPVVQSDIEGTRWNASNPSTFLFKSGSAEDLAAAMDKVMAYDRKELQRKCQFTAARNLEALSLENWTNRIIEFFKEL